jgi:hypothetical protein
MTFDFGILVSDDSTTKSVKKGIQRIKNKERTNLLKMRGNLLMMEVEARSQGDTQKTAILQCKVEDLHRVTVKEVN